MNIFFYIITICNCKWPCIKVGFLLDGKIRGNGFGVGLFLRGFGLGSYLVGTNGLINFITLDLNQGHPTRNLDEISVRESPLVLRLSYNALTKTY